MTELSGCCKLGGERMAQAFAEAFYNSSAWRKCRAAYISERISIDGGMCETCHEEPGYIVHHKIRLTADNINDPDISLNHAHLKYDCLICHNREEADRSDPDRGYFSADGDYIPYPPLKEEQ